MSEGRVGENVVLGWPVGEMSFEQGPRYDDSQVRGLCLEPQISKKDISTLGPVMELR